MKHLKLYENFNRRSVEDLLKIIHSNGAYEILDEVDGNTWQEGGCWILADALKMLYSDLDLPVYVVFKHELNMF